MRVFVEALGGLKADWSLLFLIISVVTLMLGNVVAIVQSNIKRMLAYSSIAHAGYALIGFAAAGRGVGRSRIGLARRHRPDLCRRIGLLLHAGGHGHVYARSESLFHRAATPRDLAGLILRVGLCRRGRDSIRPLSQPSRQLRAPIRP